MIYQVYPEPFSSQEGAYIHRYILSYPFFIVAVSDVFRRRKEREMIVIDAAQPLQKIFEIVSLRKSSELRCVIEPHIDYLRYII